MEKRIKKTVLLWLVMVLVMAMVFAGCGDTKTPPATQPQPQPQPTTAPAPTEPPEEPCSIIYAKVPEDWTSVSIWAWKYEGEDAFEAWPGKLMTPGEDGWYSAKIPLWADCVIINGNGGSVQTYDLMVGAGLDAWINVKTAEYADIFYQKPTADMLNSDPFLDAALRGDFETMKELLPTIDRSILTEWDYNDFNYAYAVEAIQAGDYETAIEFFDYCAFEGNSIHAEIFRKLLAGDVEGAMAVKKDYGFTTLESKLDMTWPEIICAVLGVEKDENNVNYLLLDKYLNRLMWTNQPSFTENSLVYGEYSAWMAEGYIGPIGASRDYPSVSSLDALYDQCGSNPKGKILVVRSQKSFPSGSTYYAIDMDVMEYLGYDLYPASLSEVEYVIVMNYDYSNEGTYKQTFSSEYASTETYFDFLRMKGRVDLIQVSNGKTLYQSSWVKGAGEVQAHFSDLDYQCSDMPEIGVYVKEAVAKVQQRNAG